MAIKPVLGYEGLYSITDDGRVWSNHSDKFLSLSRRPNSYLAVSLSKDGKPIKKSVHRLVAETFLLNSKNKPQVNHLDGNKNNNIVSNLEWATRSENGKHAVKIGLTNPSLSNKGGLLNGEGNGRSKLTWQDVHVMRMNCESIIMGEKPWEKYNISGNEYHNIIHDKTWVLEPPYWDVNIYIERNHNGENNPNAKLTQLEIKKIRENHKIRIRGEKTWEKYGVSQALYWKIISNKIWRNEN